ncbi:MAG: 4-amino-4-deoxy-L-arabinose transferase-like glycosyltransferase [Hyphomicrobiaceae bacterium]
MAALFAKTKSVDDRCWRFWSVLAGRRIIASILLGLIALVSYLPGQLNLPTIDRTEGTVALSSRYIAESGDILRPRWRQNSQLTRPVGTFWAQALSLSVHDKERWNDIATYRLPSMLSTILAVLLMFWLGSRLFGPVPALMASTAIAVTPIVALHAQLAIAEALILPMTVVAQFALLAIYRDASAARWFGWLGAFWVALGLSTWFNALAVPLLALVTVATLAVVDRRWDMLRRLQPWFGLPLLAWLSVPWLAAVSAIGDGTLYSGMSLRAVLDALEGGQSMKFKTIHGVFIVMVGLGFLPIAHMLGPVVTRYWRYRHDATVRFLLVWLIAPIVALEVLSNKPPLYTVQVVFPSGALLVALAVGRIEPYAHSLRALPGMFVGTVVLLVVVAPVLIWGVLFVTDTPLTLVHVVGFLIFAGLFSYAGWVSAHGFGMAWFSSATLGTFIFGLWFNGLLMPGLKNFWTAPQIAEAVTRLKHCTAGSVHISGFREPSLALKMFGRATIDAPHAAAASLVGAPMGAAIIESRQFDAFQNALQKAAPGAAVRDLGCIRSFNLARGCSLLFNVYVPAKSRAVHVCKLGLPKDCTAKHELLRKRLKIKHCG